MISRRYKTVEISMHTIDDEELPLARNIQLLEIDIDLFNGLSKQEFIDHAIQTAEKFWKQMANGRLKKNMVFKHSIIKPDHLKNAP